MENKCKCNSVFNTLLHSAEPLPGTCSCINVSSKLHNWGRACPGTCFFWLLGELQKYEKMEGAKVIFQRGVGKSHCSEGIMGKGCYSQDLSEKLHGCNVIRVRKLSIILWQILPAFVQHYIFSIVFATFWPKLGGDLLKMQWLILCPVNRYDALQVSLLVPGIAGDTQQLHAWHLIGCNKYLFNG